MKCYFRLLFFRPQFLPHDAMRCVSIRSLLSPGVRLSVTLVYCIQTAEDVVKLLSLPGSPMIRFLDSKRRYPIPRGTLQPGR